MGRCGGIERSPSKPILRTWLPLPPETVGKPVIQRAMSEKSHRAFRFYAQALSFQATVKPSLPPPPFCDCSAPSTSCRHARPTLRLEGAARPIRGENELTGGLELLHRGCVHGAQEAAGQLSVQKMRAAEKGPRLHLETCVAGVQGLRSPGPLGSVAPASNTRRPPVGRCLARAAEPWRICSIPRRCSSGGRLR